MSRSDTRRKLLNDLCPYAPFEDAAAILEAASDKNKKALPPSISLWLAIVAHIRHRHTDYDKLLTEEYDRDSARHFTREQINVILRRWGCSKKLSEEEKI